MRPADTGTVLYDNRDLYQNYNELRYRIGLVPQESVLHTQLTARRALQYSAELRFPADTKAAERDGRVDEVMGELGLTKHANTRADRLSGGQLKRVNVAQELLTKPSLLFLDEPTSGLDPGLDKSVMEQMRDLAHDGRTVIVVTHSVANLDTCDRLLVLVPGGRIAYYGPPDEGLATSASPAGPRCSRPSSATRTATGPPSSPLRPPTRSTCWASGHGRRQVPNEPGTGGRAAAAAARRVPADDHADPAVRAGDRVRPRLPDVHGPAALSSSAR